MCKTLSVLRGIWEWYPPVGVFIAILAIVSVVVPFFRDLAKISRGEKALWTVVMLGLMLLEVKSIYQERDNHDREQAEIRKEELRQFSGIAGRINETLNQVTGGGQYCFLIAFPWWKDQMQLSVINSGQVPLERCGVRILKNVRKPPTPKSFEEALKLSKPILVRELGPVVPGKTQLSGEHPSATSTLEIPLTMRTTDIILPYGSYKIYITTRNDSFSEILTILPNTASGKNNKEGFEHIEVKDEKGTVLFLSNLEVRDKSGKVLFKPAKPQ
jgi:hypothetical protein